MLTERYIDLGILLWRLMMASEGREITFKDKGIIVKGQSGKITEIPTVTGMTLSQIEDAIGVAID